MERGASAADMKDGRVSDLTAAQREVLRLWLTRKSAKEIGRAIGVTHWAVNERLRSARRVLGVATSSEAAELLARGDEEAAYKPLVCDAAGVDDGGERMAAMPSVEGDRQSGPGAYLLREERLPFAVPASSPWPRLPVPRFWGDRNALTLRARFLWIGALAAGIVIMVGALVSIAYGAGRIVSHLIRAFG